MTAGINALPYPIYAAPQRIVFPIYDDDGDLVSGAAGLDSEISKDTGSFADCANEATEIGTSGLYYLDLTAAECTADIVALVVKTTTTGAKTTPIVLYPRRLGTVAEALTPQATAEGSITLPTSAVDQDGYYVGCLAQIGNNNPAGAQGQTRIITAYTGATRLATVAPNWAVTPTAETSTVTLLAPEGRDVPGAAWKHPARTLTALSTALALGIWDVLQSAVTTASSMGLLVKTVLGALAPLAVDLYQAQIEYQEDAAEEVDRYTVRWLRNGAAVAPEDITSPTIAVYKRSDGLTLIGATALQWDPSGNVVLLYDATGAERNSSADVLLVSASATIDGGQRVATRIVQRDR
jgi:hypothetical protein